MTERDDAFWRSLLGVEISSQDALELFQSLGLLQVAHPTNAPTSPPLSLLIDDAQDADHVLFKSKDDTHNRKFAMQARPEDYQLDRAERILWIPEILRCPDAVYRQLKPGEEFSVSGRFIYVARVCDGQRFAVLLDKYSKRKLAFITAYTINETLWKKLILRKTYPMPKKRNPKKQKKQKKIEPA